MSASSSPTRLILEHLEAGVGTLHEIGARTGLDVGVVSLAVDRLVAAGYLHAERLTVGCPDDGCTTCPSGQGGRPGCGATSGGTQGAPVLITLGPARR
jgi:hypothetical protein